MNCSDMKKSFSVAFLSIFCVYVIALLVFGKNGIAALAGIQVAPFLLLLERSFDHPIDIHSHPIIFRKMLGLGWFACH